MADKKKDQAKSSAPGIDPKAVHVGGDSLIDRIVPHIKKIAVTVIVVAVVVSGILVFRWRGEVKKQVSTEKLLDTMEVARREVGPEPTPPPVPGKTPPKTPEARFATDKDRADAVLASLDANGANAPASFKGSLLMDAGKVDDAISEYKSGAGIEGIEGLMNREGLGLALEAKATAEKDATVRQKGLEEALAAFVAMQPDDAGPRRAYALYHQGRIQQLLGKTAEAKALFEKAKPLASAEEPETKDPETNAKLLPAMIDRRLASL